jgi:proteasome accessory factor C
MAKDTEKLLRQLSLISFLMAERRPVTALEIKREVEGYSGMNDDAFARRFYADRAELESLGIELRVEKPAEGYYEAENYSLPPENFYLEPIEFNDAELAGLRTTLSLLDGEFAYAEPLRLALQQLSWGKPSPLAGPASRSVALAVTAGAGGRELSQRLSKIETAIFRRKTILFDYYTMGRDALESRKVDPYHLLFRDRQYYLIGHSHERGDVRVFRLTRIRGKVGYSSKAEHDFPRPKEFDPRLYANRAPWQYGEIVGTARVWLSDKIEWLEARHYRTAGTFDAHADGDGAVFETDYADARRLAGWVMSLREHARILDPPQLLDEAGERLKRIIELHTGEPELARPARRKPQPVEEADTNGKRETPIRPERFARLVTLAGILIEAARSGDLLDVRRVCDSLQVSDEELREDIDVLNVVNFGGGSYVLYAEVKGDSIEVDPEPYGDNFAQPARLLPLEAKALIAAIDLIGDHVPEASLASAREKIVDALGQDPAEEGLQITSAAGDDPTIAHVVSTAIAGNRVLEIDYYKPNEDELTAARRIEPYLLFNGEEGWYILAWDSAKGAERQFRLDRIHEARILEDTFEPRPEVRPEVPAWAGGAPVPASEIARVWISPEQARWAREDRDNVQELADGSVIVDYPYKGLDYLVRAILGDAGDAAVIEPEDARAAVLEAAGALAGVVSH